MKSPVGTNNVAKGNHRILMRERDREIKRRRQRYNKRKKLRQKLAGAAEGDQQRIEAKIRKTYPAYMPPS